MEDKLKRAVRTHSGFKTIMSVLAEEEGKKQVMIQALTTASAPALAAVPASTPGITPVLASTSAVPRNISFPATSLKPSSILEKK